MRIDPEAMLPEGCESGLSISAPNLAIGHMFWCSLLEVYELPGTFLRTENCGGFFSGERFKKHKKWPVTDAGICENDHRIGGQYHVF